MAQTKARRDARRLQQTRSPRLPRVLAVVVTHNGREWLRDCLVALNMQTYAALDVLVVDDGSPGRGDLPRLNRIAKRHLRRKRWGFLRTPRPLGLGAAANWALGRVRTKAELLLFVHDDAALDARAVERMVACMLADDQTGIVGPKVVSWDDPDVLEEVGMAVDHLGYPYKGLERGEIDLGQHDSPSEVFYVTSTCMLMRHDLFKQLRGWDARMRAYTEDLDLCWRARVAGYSVRVEPSARARHAIAMATGARVTPYKPARYYIRRNRLRAIAKNASGPRLLALVPQYVLLTLLEMVAFVLLRQPRESGNLARALLWNLGALPQTLTERRRVQKRRRVSDRQLGRLQVRAATRVRSYIGAQTDRLEKVWGQRAEILSARGTQARAIGRHLTGYLGVALLVLLLGALLGVRGYLWSSPAAVGDLLPFPSGAMSMWREFLSPWQQASLGGPGPAPPALALLGVFPFVTFGAAGAAQKLLVLLLGAAAFVGAWRLVAGLVDRAGRVAASFAYVLGGVGYAGVRDGRLSALVFGAAAPYVLLELLRILGWVRPPGWHRGRAVAVVALGGAISAAFVPGSLFLYGLAVVVLALARSFFAREKLGRETFVCLGSLVVAWVLLLPWSATWWSGGPLAQLTGDDTWATFARSFRGDGMMSVILGQTPDTPPLLGVALPVLGIVAAVVSRDGRKRLALALWLVLAVFGWLISLIGTGTLRPVVASPTEAGVIVSVAFAALAGLAVGAFRLDLPARGLGTIHALTLFGLAAAGFLATVGALPALVGGHWNPGRDQPVHAGKKFEQIRAVLEADVARFGQFRALWVGRAWIRPAPTASRPTERHFLTGPHGPMATDLFARPSHAAVQALERVIASIEEGTTDHGGRLLGAFNIRFVVLERDRYERAWLEQQDLSLVRSESGEAGFFVLQNELVLNRAAAYAHMPRSVRAIGFNRPEAAVGRHPSGRRARRTGPWHYEAGRVRGPGVVFVSESSHEGWKAEVDDEDLRPVDAKWGNAFAVPAGAKGPLDVRFPRTFGRAATLVILGLAWLTVLGGVVSRRDPPARRQG